MQLNGPLPLLSQYLPTLKTHALSVIGHNESQVPGHRQEGCSSLGGAPDSAIDMSCDDTGTTSSSLKRRSTLSRPRSVSLSHWEEPLDEFDGELNEMPIQISPLPLPPRSSSRFGTSVASHTFSQRPTTSDSRYGTRLAVNSRASNTSTFSPTSQHYSQEQTNDLPPRPGTRTHSRRSSIFGQVRYAIWENPRPAVGIPTHSKGPVCEIPSSNQRQSSTSLLLRSGSKLCATFRGLRLKTSLVKAIDDHPEVDVDSVFGVPLAKSMHIAKGIASTRHGNGATSVRATREYPLCVLRCVYYIRDCGVDAPHIFGLDSDQIRLAQLKATFSSAESSYGRELDWSQFTVHDAANLILLYLLELPKPLISESAGKRWIALSRQATMRTARLDQGLDFWEEVLTNVHGPARTLFKLLLNLWGDIADAAADNEMTAERLAGRVLRPLMHSTLARHTDFILGLAFMIRKRSEYNLAARCVARKSNAAF